MRNYLFFVGIKNVARFFVLLLCLVVCFGYAVTGVHAADTVVEQQTPTASTSQGVATGPDGHVWFTETSANQIGRVAANDTGPILEYPLPTADAQPADISAGPDGALWFTEHGAGQIGRITTAGQISEYPVSLLPGARPYGITSCDGSLWFTDLGLLTLAGRIGKITTSGTVTLFAVPPLFGLLSRPDKITCGLDGSLWFTDQATNHLGQMTPFGQFTLYDVPTAAAGLNDLTTAPDGTIWFTEESTGYIGFITPDGSIQEYTTLQNASPVDIVAIPTKSNSIYYLQVTASVPNQPPLLENYNYNTQNNSLGIIADDHVDITNGALEVVADEIGKSGATHTQAQTKPFRAGVRDTGVGSPGVISGNVIQVPIHVPVNVCGNSVNVIGLLNPAFGNTCVNT